MKEKCKFSTRYKGNRKPTCCRDVGCKTCWKIFQEKRGYARIENWFIHSAALDPAYAPPEAGISLGGNVFGHRFKGGRHPDGKRIRTSRIINVNGRIVKTFSGSIYVLGEPCPDFVAWCEQTNKEFGTHIPTDKEPIKVRKVKLENV